MDPSVGTNVIVALVIAIMFLALLAVIVGAVTGTMSSSYPRWFFPAVMTFLLSLVVVLAVAGYSIQNPEQGPTLLKGLIDKLPNFR